MAESSLDDFFAKKDKSKKKSKSSKLTPSDIIAKTEEPAKKKKSKKDKDKTQTTSNSTVNSDTIGLTVNPEEVWIACESTPPVLSSFCINFLPGTLLFLI